MHYNSYLLNSIGNTGHRPRTELEGRETRETLGADHFSTVIPNIITIFVLERLEGEMMIIMMIMMMMIVNSE